MCILFPHENVKKAKHGFFYENFDSNSPLDSNMISKKYKWRVCCQCITCHNRHSMVVWYNISCCGFLFPVFVSVSVTFHLMVVQIILVRIWLVAQ